MHSGKNRKVASRLIIFLFVAVSFVSCMQSLIPVSSPVQTPPGKGKVTIRIAPESRVVIPYSISEIASISLEGQRDAGPTSLLGSWTSAELEAGVSLDLPYGLWNFDMKAFDGEGLEILSASVSNRVINGDSVLFFSLAPSLTGTGIVDVTLVWPGDTSTVSVYTSFNGIEVEPALIPLYDPDSNSWSVRYLNEVAPSGVRRLVFILQDSASNTIISSTNTVWVRANLTSHGTITLLAEHFNSSPVAPSDFTVAALPDVLDADQIQAELLWDRTTTTETGYRLEYSVDEGSSWTMLAELPAGSISFLDSIPRGIKRYYRLSAFNKYGFSHWSHSNSVTAPWLVQFDSRGGTAVPPQENLHQSHLVRPADPSLDGYTFAGWFKDTDASQEWIFETDLVSSNSILFAGWNIIETPVTDFQYSISGGEVAITRYTGTAVDVVVPAFIEGLPVTSLADGTTTNYVFKDKSVVSVHLPDSVKKIGANAFYHRYSLKTIHLGTGIEEIGYQAFLFCTQLESIDLGQKLKKIDEYAFSYTQKVTSMSFPATLETLELNAIQTAQGLASLVVSPANTFFSSLDGVLFNKDQTDLLLYPRARTGASYVVPDGTTVINASAFFQSQLSAIQLPDSLQEIGFGAFWGSRLTEITIPSSVSLLSSQLFRDCTLLKTVFLNRETPAAGIDFSSFSNAHADLKIIVPKGLVTAYKTATGWSSHASKIMWAGYRFYRNGNWFTGPDSEAYNYFGLSMALSGDGQVMASLDFPGGTHTASTSARVLVYRRNGDGWLHSSTIDFPENAGLARWLCYQYKNNLALSYDGRVILFGNRTTSSAFILTSTDGVTWSRTAELTASSPVSESIFASSVSLSDDGSVALVGAFCSLDTWETTREGRAYVFKEGGIWTDMTETAVLTTTEMNRHGSFGYRVALSGDGNTALVGAYKDQRAALGVEDGVAGYYHKQGSVYYYGVNAQNWVSMTETRHINTVGTGMFAGDFGISLALTPDGSSAVVGAKNAALVFEKQGAEWVAKAKLTASDAERVGYFGDSVALSRDAETILVGDYYYKVGTENWGAVFLYMKETSWISTIEDARFMAPPAINDQDADFFGESIALYPDRQTILVCAWQAKEGTDYDKHAQGLIYTFDYE